MNKKHDSYSQPRLDSISESSDRTELLSTKSTDTIMAIVISIDFNQCNQTEEQKPQPQLYPNTKNKDYDTCQIMANKSRDDQSHPKPEELCHLNKTNGSNMEISSKNTVSPTSKNFKDLKTLQENDKKELKSEKISTNQNLKNEISIDISKNDVNQPTPLN